MTATLTKPASSRRARDRYLKCPECETPTARVLYMGWYGTDLQMLSTASGADDGLRCTAHARTVEQRWAETRWALRHVLRRLVPSPPDEPVYVDDTARGTE